MTVGLANGAEVPEGDALGVGVAAQVTVRLGEDVAVALPVKLAAGVAVARLVAVHVCAGVPVGWLVAVGLGVSEAESVAVGVAGAGMEGDGGGDKAFPMAATMSATVNAPSPFRSTGSHFVGSANKAGIVARKAFAGNSDSQSLPRSSSGYTQAKSATSTTFHHCPCCIASPRGF